jgi:trehalose-6-phosphatase
LTNWRDHHFDTVEVIKAESQAVLNTTFKTHLKNGRVAENGAYVQKVTASRVIVASKP